MSIQITRDEAERKYGPNYVEILKENLWIQSYRKTEYPSDEFVDKLWLPTFEHLWKIVESLLPFDFETDRDIDEYLSDKISFSREQGDYKARIDILGITSTGASPEETILNLLINFLRP